MSRKHPVKNRFTGRQRRTDTFVRVDTRNASVSTLETGKGSLRHVDTMTGQANTMLRAENDGESKLLLGNYEPVFRSGVEHLYIRLAISRADVALPGDDPKTYTEENYAGDGQRIRGTKKARQALRDWARAHDLTTTELDAQEARTRKMYTFAGPVEFQTESGQGSCWYGVRGVITRAALDDLSDLRVRGMVVECNAPVRADGSGTNALMPKPEHIRRKERQARKEAGEARRDLSCEMSMYTEFGVNPRLVDCADASLKKPAGKPSPAQKDSYAGALADTRTTPVLTGDKTRWMAADLHQRIPADKTQAEVLQTLYYSKIVPLHNVPETTAHGCERR